MKPTKSHPASNDNRRAHRARPTPTWLSQQQDLDEMASEQWQRYGRASDPMAVARKLLELRPECAP